jgi:hypothetical protein
MFKFSLGEKLFNSGMRVLAPCPSRIINEKPRVSGSDLKNLNIE